MKRSNAPRRKPALRSLDDCALRAVAGGIIIFGTTDQDDASGMIIHGTADATAVPSGIRDGLLDGAIIFWQER